MASSSSSSQPPPAPRGWAEWLAEVQGDGVTLPMAQGSELGPRLRVLPPKDMRLPLGMLDAEKLARFDLRPLPELPGLGNTTRAPVSVEERRRRQAERQAAEDAAAAAREAQNALVQLEEVEANLCMLAKAVYDSRPTLADVKKWLPPQPKTQSNGQRAAQLLDDAMLTQLQVWEREHKYDKAAAPLGALRVALVTELQRRRRGDPLAAAGLAERKRRDALAAREEVRMKTEALESNIFRLAVAVEAAKPPEVPRSEWLHDVAQLPPKRVAMLLSKADNRKRLNEWIQQYGPALSAAGITCLHDLLPPLTQYAEILVEGRARAAAHQGGQDQRKRRLSAAEEGSSQMAGQQPPARKARVEE
mmetsp:Transcript_27088/g.82050  ORF Transcript_27088/g.82050 Transcript_27088/m.82050 type:complete len:361 (-) Transcript_27088:305-1387(-)